MMRRNRLRRLRPGEWLSTLTMAIFDGAPAPNHPCCIKLKCCHAQRMIWSCLRDSLVMLKARIGTYHAYRVWLEHNKVNSHVLTSFFSSFFCLLSSQSLYGPYYGIEVWGLTCCSSLILVVLVIVVGVVVELQVCRWRNGSGKDGGAVGGGKSPTCQRWGWRGGEVSWSWSCWYWRKS